MHQLRGVEVEHFPSFWEGLSLRYGCQLRDFTAQPLFPLLFGGAFIEERNAPSGKPSNTEISLPFWRGFH